MKARRVVTLVVAGVASAAVVVAATASAANTWNSPPQTNSTAEVLSILGKNQPRPAGENLIQPLTFNAALNTKISCGQVGVNLSWTSLQSLFNEVNQIPGQLASNAMTLVGALPMMTLCAGWPSLCAEVKNLNFEVHEKLKLLGNQCKAIDDYINSQATSAGVRSLAEKQGWQNCVSQRIASGSSTGDAIVGCENTSNPPLKTDIAQAWLREATLTGPQNVIESLLTASGQKLASGPMYALGETRYRAMTALMGEMQVDVNGKVIPVFPAPPLTAATVAKKMVTFSTSFACDQAQLLAAVNGTLSTNPDPAERFLEQQQLDVTHESLESVDVDNLFMLDPPDRNQACASLGRTAAREGMLRLADETDASLATAMQNLAVPDVIQKEVIKRIRFTIPALRTQRVGPQVLTFTEWRNTVARMARLTRHERREEAAEVSAKVLDEQQNFTHECEDEASCN